MHSERSDAASGAATDLPDGRRTVASRVDGMKTLAGALGQLPVTVRFWDGSAVVSRDAPDAPVVLIRDERAIAHFLRAPNQLGLGRAWVSGALDVDGDLEPCSRLRRRVGEPRARRAWSARGSPPPPCASPARASCAGRPIPAVRGAPARAAALAAPRPRRDPPPLRRLQRLLRAAARPEPRLLVRLLRRAGRTRSKRAQERKLELICRKLRLGPGERLLDIGCGWGSLLLHAARAPRRARRRRHALGAAGRSSRASASRRPGWPTASRSACSTTASSTDGPFDKIASVGMFEHVGRAQLDAYVGTVHALLRPGGLFLNHGIARLHSAPAARPDVHQPLRLPGRRAAPGDRRHRRARGRRLRDPRRRVAARALRADAARAGSPTSPPAASEAVAEIGERARARLAALHARLGAGLRGAARSASTRCSPPARAPRTASRSTVRTSSFRSGASQGRRAALGTASRLSGEPAATPARSTYLSSATSRGRQSAAATKTGASVTRRPLARLARRRKGWHATAMPRLNIASPEFTLRRRRPRGLPRRACSASGKRSARRSTGLSVYELPPGQSICPYHYEYGEEEWLLVLEGTPTLRTPEGEEQLGPHGDRLLPARPRGRPPGAQRHRCDRPRADVLDVEHPAVDRLSRQRQGRDLHGPRGGQRDGPQVEQRRVLRRRDGSGRRAERGACQASRARRYRSMRVSASGEASRTRPQSRSRTPAGPSPNSQRSRASLRGVPFAVMNRWARLRTASSSASVRRRRLRALPLIGAMLAARPSGSGARGYAVLPRAGEGAAMLAKPTLREGCTRKSPEIPLISNRRVT